jgi:hypothetical protein
MVAKQLAPKVQAFALPLGKVRAYGSKFSPTAFALHQRCKVKTLSFGNILVQSASPFLI